MENTYRTYRQENIGNSKIAALTLIGPSPDAPGGLASIPIFFDKNSSYSAYIVDENAKLETGCNLAASFTSWMKIYDDNGLAKEYRAGQIRVYHGRDTVIQLLPGSGKGPSKEGNEPEENEIRRVMDILGDNAREFSRRYGIPYNTVIAWTHGRRKPSPWTLALLTRVAKEDSGTKAPKVSHIANGGIKC